MSTRTTFRPASVITAGDMSANITSRATILNSLSGVSYAVSWTGTSPVGTLSVQVSDDYSLNPDGTVNNSGTWTTIYLNVNGTPSTTIAVSGNTGNGYANIAELMAYAVRLIYTFTSGVGTLSATINCKVT